MAKKQRILLIEDNVMDVELTKEAFAEVCKNCDLHVVLKGQEGLDYLLGRGEYDDRDTHPLPDLILLDLKMPDISGIELLGQIKEVPALKLIPVVIMTSSKERQDILSCYESGVNSYLVKPTSFDTFVKLIGRVVEYWLSFNVTLRND